MAEQVKKNIFQQEIELGKAINDKFKEYFYNELASLVGSGIDLRRSLELLAEEQSKKKIKDVLTKIVDQVVKGASFSEALKDATYFSAYEYQSIHIGEETGRLQLIFSSLSTYFGDKVRLKRQLTSVFMYPSFVFAITIGVLYFMLNFVVPMFEDVFKQFGQDLPWLTQQIVWLSEHFSTFVFYFLIVAIGLSIYFYSQRQQIWFRDYSSRFLLKIPLFGTLMRKIYIARFCQSMALLTESKTPLLQALDLVKNMIGFYPLEVLLTRSKEELLKGNSLHSGLSSSDLLDKRLISLVKIAEEVNQLEETFARVAKQYREEIDHRTKLIGTIIEPAIIVVIGLIVGLIMVSMYLPMFNLSNVIK